jgi:hypothetical protein
METKAGYETDLKFVHRRQNGLTLLQIVLEMSIMVWGHCWEAYTQRRILFSFSAVRHCMV